MVVDLDYGPSQAFLIRKVQWQLRKQPTNNKAIKPQLMQRFLNDNFTSPCPQELNKILLILKFKIKLWHGSVRETLLPANVQVHKVILPTKC